MTEQAALEAAKSVAQQSADLETPKRESVKNLLKIIEQCADLLEPLCVADRASVFGAIRALL